MAFTGKHSVQVYLDAYVLSRRDLSGEFGERNRYNGHLKSDEQLYEETGLFKDRPRSQMLNGDTYAGGGISLIRSRTFRQIHPYLIAAERQMLDHAARDRVRNILRAARYHHEHVGYDLPANTAQRTAIDKIEAIRQLGHREMDRTQNENQLRRVRDSAISDLQAVAVAGVPQWSFYGAPDDAGTKSSTKITGGEYTPTWSFVEDAKTKVADLVVANPDGLKKGGKVSVELTLDFDLPPGFSVETSVPSGSRDKQDLTLYYKRDRVPAAGTKFTLTARNNNGPTALTVVAA